MGFSTFLIKHLYWLLLFTFLTLHLTEIGTAAQFDPSQYPDIHRQERDALYALKSSFNNSFLNDNWTGPHCSTDSSSRWHGIQCFNGRVTEISLESMRMNATLMDIDAFVFLTELTVLSLKNNSISGNMINFSSNNKMKQLDLSAWESLMSPTMISMARSPKLTLYNLLAPIHILVTLNCVVRPRSTPAKISLQQ